MWGKWALSFMKKKLDIFPRSGFNTPMTNPDLRPFSVSNENMIKPS